MKKKTITKPQINIASKWINPKMAFPEIFTKQSNADKTNIHINKPIKCFVRKIPKMDTTDGGNSYLNAPPYWKWPTNTHT